MPVAPPACILDPRRHGAAVRITCSQWQAVIHVRGLIVLHDIHADSDLKCYIKLEIKDIICEQHL
jgi:hypothetical protein